MPKTPTLPWTPCAVGPGDRSLAHVPASWPFGLHEYGTRLLWRLLVAAGGRGFVLAVSDLAPCSGTPSSACIHPAAPKKGWKYYFNTNPF